MDVPPPVIVVEIDVRPGSDADKVSSKSNGTVPVAVFGSASFDVGAIDVATVSMGDNAPADPNHAAREDVNADGFVDMVFKFPARATQVLEPGTNLVCLRGRTTAGVAFKGCDVVTVK